MERLKQYSAAAVAAVLALIFLVVAVAALTVFKPAQELSSSVIADQSLVMTRDGVLPLVSSEVTVNATSASGATVALAVGTPGDVIGWIGADPYTEIVGLTSDRAVLKVEEHSGTVRVDAQSGDAQSGDSQSGAQSGEEQTAQSGEPSDAQSGEQDSALPSDPEAARIVSEVTASDMWLESTEATGSASLSLTGISSGRSLIAASAAGPGDLTLTLTWPMQRTNTLAIVTVLLAIVSALLAVVLFLSRRQILRHRAERARKIAERKGADTTDTQTIDTTKVAELVEAQRDEEPSDEPIEEPSDDSADEGAPEPQEETPEPVDAHEDDADNVTEPLADEPDDGPADEDPLDTDAEDSHTGEEDQHDAPADDTDASATNDDEQDDEEPQASGRHGEYTGTDDEDPPQKVPTDTGIIDLGAVRPGASLPSRRALREARERGEQTLIVDGREFDTGLIPVVSADSPPAEAQQAEDEIEEDTHEQTEQPENRAQTSAWTSIMSGWLKKRD